MINDLINQIALRFKSGNSIPIERAHITAAEWDELSAALRATGEGEWLDDAACLAVIRAVMNDPFYGTEGSASPERIERTRAALLAAAPTPAEPLEREILDFITMVPGDRTHELLVKRGWTPPTGPTDEKGRPLTYWGGKPAEPLRGESRFFIDHGIVHDRLTGKHLRGTDEYGDKASDLLAVLQELESRSLLQITRAKLRQQIANDTDDEPEASSPLQDAGAGAGLLRRFRDYVSNHPAAQGMSHHDPIWAEVADFIEAHPAPQAPMGGRLEVVECANCECLYDAEIVGCPSCGMSDADEAHPAPQQPAEYVPQMNLRGVLHEALTFVLDHADKDEDPEHWTLTKELRAALTAAQEGT